MYFFHVSAEGLVPNFDVPILNATAVSGTTAVLPCTITALKDDHKVAWVDPRKKLLTVAEKRIITDPRISVERPFTKDWNLHIRNVRLNDSGEYLCQINTKPVKSMKILLTIHEPPSILEHSGDQTVREGDTVALWCKVGGEPYPAVTWYRQYVHEKNSAKSIIGEEGEALRIHNISRYCEDVYECVANNDIEPTASKRMKVSVEFPPEVQLYNTRMGQGQGKETIIDCKITANPQGYIVWQRQGREITNSHKYGITVYEEDRYTTTLSLRIARLNEDDFGKYKCHAQNKYGTDTEDMMLYEFVEPQITSTSSTTTEYLVIDDTNPWKKRLPVYNDRYSPTQGLENHKYRGNAGASRAGTDSTCSGSYHVILTMWSITVHLVIYYCRR
ncbi:opioid-binding protein/cell adhesion molecule homolog [Ruditapes philippinarum]|uniref:opioid-binding protein/cell adhesion molecule homolog n=1 Tax=Ruditapes philippinarum TaxID=129788 RepID=UPI00295BA41A|nr:opioid-binding protein/cell adhesion molecule homolog [Ruditapes philippinarum]